MKPVFICPGCGATATTGPFYRHACGYDKRQEDTAYDQAVIEAAKQQYDVTPGNAPTVDEKEAPPDAAGG